MSSELCLSRFHRNCPSRAMPNHGTTLRTDRDSIVPLLVKPLGNKGFSCEWSHLSHEANTMCENWLPAYSFQVALSPVIDGTRPEPDLVSENFNTIFTDCAGNVDRATRWGGIPEAVE